jgi:peptidoglycan/LPS O-acetylase OafA/YrhL
MLNGWRALAALTVVCHHLQLGSQFNVGHVAVMVFFVISGYCIAATSESCFRSGSGFKSYMFRRVRRIYPPYFCAVCFFAATRLLKWKQTGVMQLSSSVAAWLQTLTLTQWFSLLWHPVSYASENRTLCVAAFWSLNYEEQFYIVIGLMMLLSARVGRPILWGVLGLMIPAFAWNLIFPSTSYGFFLEYWIHFSLGMLVYYRLCNISKASAHLAVDAGLSILVIFSGIAWTMHAGPGFAIERIVYAEWFIAGTFALLLIAARSVDDALSHTWIGSALIRLGTLTYSLYLVHQFNIQASEGFAKLLLRVGIPHALKIPIQLSVILLIAAIFWYLCERPYINKPLIGDRNRRVVGNSAPTLTVSA